MHEQILATICRSDEAEPLCCVEPLHCALTALPFLLCHPEACSRVGLGSTTPALYRSSSVLKGLLRSPDRLLAGANVPQGVAIPGVEIKARFRVQAVTKKADGGPQTWAEGMHMPVELQT